jgi:hypothetical protein
MITPIIHLLHAVIATFLVTSAPATSTNIEDTIHFAPDHNIYVAQSTCDLEDAPPLSDEMTKRLARWDRAVKAGKFEGRVICVD